MSTTRRTPGDWLLLSLLVALWSPSFLLIKVGLEDGIPPVTLVVMRLGLAAAVLYGIMRASRVPLPRDRATWWALVAVGIAGSSLPFVLIAIGEQTAPSALASICNGAVPIATSLLAHRLLPEERLPGRAWLGVIVAFLGILLITFPAFGRWNGEAIGLILFFVAAVSYGLNFVVARRWLTNLPPLVAPTFQLVIGAAVLLPWALAVEVPTMRMPGTGTIVAMLGLALLGTALAYVVNYKLISTTDATFASTVTYFLPPFGVLLSVIFLHEEVAPTALGGSALVLVGVVVLNLERRRHALNARAALLPEE